MLEEDMYERQCSIGEIVRKFYINKETIRYYEESGYFPNLKERKMDIGYTRKKI